MYVSGIYTRIYIHMSCMYVNGIYIRTYIHIHTYTWTCMYVNGIYTRTYIYILYCIRDSLGVALNGCEESVCQNIILNITEGYMRYYHIIDSQIIHTYTYIQYINTVHLYIHTYTILIYM